MVGAGHWGLLVAFGVGATGVALLWYLGTRGTRPLRFAWRKVTCPATGERVECGVDQRVSDERWVAIRSCDRFAPRGRVTCTQACLEQLNEPAALKLRAAKTDAAPQG